MLRKHNSYRTRYIPNCAAALRAVRNRAIHDRFDQLTSQSSNPVYSSNEAVALLAREHRISDRRVWDILKVLPEATSQQLGMFG